MARKVIQAMDEQQPTLSVIEQLRQLDEQRKTLMESAKADAMRKAEEAIAELNALGFQYIIHDMTEQPRATRMPRPKSEADAPKRQQKDAECPICGFKTTPLHDKRSHRFQSEKMPFTAEELSERDMVRVD